MKTYSNIVPKYSAEIFAAIEKATDRKAALKEWGSKPPMNFLLAMNFDDRIEFNLPTGMPPYNRNEADSPDMYAPLSTFIRKIMICLKTNTTVKPYKKESIFIQMLEGINPDEADILVAAKDRALTELYPFLTFDFVASVFPAYCHKASTWLDKTEQ